MLERLQGYIEKITPVLLRYSIQVMNALDWLVNQTIRILAATKNLLDKIPLTAFQWIVLIYVGLSLVYLVATPPFEASDERWHFGMVEYINENGELPIQDPEGEETAYRQEGSQPPLYYFIGAALISPIDISDVDEYRVPNPHVQAGVPGNFGNKNLVLRDTPFPPLEGTPLAVYILRLFSIGLGAITVGAVYQTAKLISPRRPVVALLATAITTLNPMFLFILASVNNDNLVIALNSVVIYLMMRMLRDGFHWRRSLLMAVLIALATLSKLSGLVVIPVVALAAIHVARRDKAWRDLIILGGLMVVIWAVLSGWWYARNLQLYGELFGTSTMVAVAGERMGEFNLLTLLSEFQGFRIAYWGLFGAVNIQTTGAFYLLMDLAVFTAIFGVIFSMLQLWAIRDFAYARREFANLFYPFLIVVIGVFAVIAWTSQTLASQGRLLFPFVSAISPLLAAGFVEVMWWLLFVLRPPERSFVRADQGVPEETLRSSSTAPLYVLGFFAVLIPFFTIMPQYARPITVESLPEDVTEVYARYGGIELIGYEVADRRYSPGEYVPIRLYWRVAEQSEQDESLFLTLLDPRGQEVGKVDTYPGLGKLRTSTWEEGAIYPDLYRVQIYPEAIGRYPLRVQVGWWHFPTEDMIFARDDNDRRLDAVVLDAGAVVIRGVPIIEGLTEPEGDIRFGDLIRLAGYGLNDEGLLILNWEAVGAPLVDYTVFVQVFDENDDLVGQSDTPPLLPTHYWRWTERYITQHDFSFLDELSPGTYRVMTGWYDPADDGLPRLQIGDGETYPDAAFPIFELVIDANGEIESPEIISTQSEVTPDPEATGEATEESDEEEVDEPASEETVEPEADVEEEQAEPESAPAPESEG